MDMLLIEFGEIHEGGFENYFAISSIGKIAQD